MTSSFSQNIIFGISGSIAAYKAIDVIRGLKKLGHNVFPIMTKSSQKFVTEWTIETISENPILNKHVHNGKISHLDICKKGPIFIICPASANIISKIATGLADDILTQAFLSFTGKKIIFPAMHTEMYENTITQSNIKKCEENGIKIIHPFYGDLACGDVGIGRLPSTDLITQIIECSQLPSLNLSNKKIIITCGGTSEYIDSVRKITNISSGKSGHALANLAALNNAEVTLIRTIKNDVLNSIHCIDVESSMQLYDELMNLTNHCDILIMNAAVSDFTVNKSDKKLTRKNLKFPTITPTIDILSQFNKQRKKDCFSIGFTLSDNPDLYAVGYQKLLEKNCNMIIANDVSSFAKNKRSIEIIEPSAHHTFKDISLPEMAYQILCKAC